MVSTRIFQHVFIIAPGNCVCGGSSCYVQYLVTISSMLQGSRHIYLFIFLFFNIFIDYTITVVPFPPLPSTTSCPPPPSHIPPLQFMSMGHVYKFFGFSISYSVLNIPIYSVPTKLYFLILAPFSLVSPYPLPTDKPPNDLHIYGSVSILLVCFVCQFQLLIVVNLLPF